MIGALDLTRCAHCHAIDSMHETTGFMEAHSGLREYGCYRCGARQHDHARRLELGERLIPGRRTCSQCGEMLSDEESIGGRRYHAACRPAKVRVPDVPRQAPKSPRLPYCARCERAITPAERAAGARKYHKACAVLVVKEQRQTWWKTNGYEYRKKVKAR